MPSSSTQYRFLFYAEQNYCFEILRPLQTLAIDAGYEVRWLLAGNSVSHQFLNADEQKLEVKEAVRWRPHAVFVPGDRVPSFIPGLKVAVFHGLNEDKRGGEYPDRGMFDLYCTEGQGRSIPLKALAKKHSYFTVRETGWLKLDGLFNYPEHNPQQTYRRPQILFASTFTPSLSCAEAVFEQIKKLSADSRWQWLITLHPKMAPETVSRYRSLEGDNLQFFDNDRVIELLHRADIMVCDNSSILQEFLLLGKPVVTFRNRDPQPCMIDIQEPAQLQGAIESALDPGPHVLEAISDYGTSITPYVDGKSSGRVLDAVDSMLDSGWQDRKPANFWRNWKMRRQLGYYRF